MQKKFTYLLRVRYSECDAQKVVFNGRYSDYVDIAVSEFIRAIWGDYNDLLQAGFDNQVVSYSINWQGPAHFDEVLACEVSAKHVGNSSFSFEVNFKNYHSNTAVAQAEIVYVMVDAQSHSKIPIPDHMKITLKQGAKDTLVNHAGVIND
ncbi:thioesterase family protein [Oceaniserpentilla sp. 4NH20-0058]|uniref:acyl-CoA thioesterase n=1 Tax=Oceaniserpentilla sp. 4NH20-0058 TaxID=3127660 RepID=UPI003101C445